MIVGLGVDVVDVARFARSLERTPSLAQRLFTPGELTLHPAVESLAARFAAKEAVAKALAHPWAGGWHDVEIAGPGQPRLVVRGGVAAVARGKNVTVWHVSLSHDGGVAVASVIAEGGSS